MTITPKTPVTELPYITKKMARAFFTLGIKTAEDLMFHIPFRYEDFSHVVPAAHLKIGEEATLRVQVLIVQNRRARTGRTLTEGLFRDASGSVKVIWFNQPYIAKLFHHGEWVYLAGTLEDNDFGVHMVNPIFERISENEETLHTARLVPIYHTTAELTNRSLRRLVGLVMPSVKQIIEWLPDDIRSHHKLLSLPAALATAHFPDTPDDALRARHRLAFDELFYAGLISCHARYELDTAQAPPIPFNESLTKKFVASLPFLLTESQRRAAWDILRDLEKTRPMNRLLEGDVGSGKTVVAALAILNATRGGYTTLYLAPTELLAMQHHRTLSKLFEKISIKTALLTRTNHVLGEKEVARRDMESAIREGTTDLVIGTHALLAGNIQPTRVGLLIIDEQHRFGVLQRKKLRTGGATSEIPHLLSMTATPIPRTLALTIYGDLDISMITELPKNREPITTTLVPPDARRMTYQHIHEEITRGRQCFVVCPLIEESDKLGVRAATSVYDDLRQNIFLSLKIGLVHGKLKSNEKNAVMDAFNRGDIQILVATAVIEVGIDVPNASIMIIEGAERFGLAQLHQFRGRIGRGPHASHCYLFTSAGSDGARERLAFFARTRNGFALAEKDLELRGPGALFGHEQSGFPAFRVADFHDRELIEKTHAEAQKLLTEDPLLANHPLVKEHLEGFTKEVHLE